MAQAWPSTPCCSSWLPWLAIVRRAYGTWYGRISVLFTDDHRQTQVLVASCKSVLVRWWSLLVADHHLLNSVQQRGGHAVAGGSKKEAERERNTKATRGTYLKQQTLKQ